MWYAVSGILVSVCLPEISSLLASSPLWILLNDMMVNGHSTVFNNAIQKARKGEIRYATVLGEN